MLGSKKSPYHKGEQHFFFEQTKTSNKRTGKKTTACFVQKPLVKSMFFKWCKTLGKAIKVWENLRLLPYPLESALMLSSRSWAAKTNHQGVDEGSSLIQNCKTFRLDLTIRLEETTPLQCYITSVLLIIYISGWAQNPTYTWTGYHPIFRHHNRSGKNSSISASHGNLRGPPRTQCGAPHGNHRGLLKGLWQNHDCPLIVLLIRPAIFWGVSLALGGVPLNSHDVPLYDISCSTTWLGLKEFSPVAFLANSCLADQARLWFHQQLVAALVIFHAILLDFDQHSHKLW